MTIKILLGFFLRELNKLKEEINLYKEEKDLWLINGTVTNSAGNLCLHLVGNLNHFIGTVIGNTGYVRKRDDEFSLKEIPRKELLSEIEKTEKMLSRALGSLTDTELVKTFPLDKHGETVSTGYMLFHLLTHLNYHLGQINYHRRMV